MIGAYILITVELGKTQAVLDGLRKILEVTCVSVTTGIYDIIVRVDVETLDDLYEVTVNKIHKIDGLVATTTAVIEKEFRAE